MTEAGKAGTAARTAKTKSCAADLAPTFEERQGRDLLLDAMAREMMVGGIPTASCVKR